MKLILCDKNEELICHLKVAFRDVPETQVECRVADILSFQADAIVSPANSFGWMTGGIDKAYRTFFGYALETRLIDLIANDSNGELPVGDAITLRTVHPNIQWLISAPTMRLPGPLPAGTRNPYLAMRAAMQRAISYGFKTVLCPGLGTLSGRVPLEIAAHQMREGWNDRCGSARWG
ncbi:macro domain-containing protein [Paraburkholderia sp. BCC1886]|uniref:macro domain-containing protein n=1 Tax=Paraburkholderia sp. BCC1886 TaxID=2562670 RepID=UPI001183BCBD|nr:macro domain-containing protein [Paraburkholderia sp. BCC1886]